MAERRMFSKSIVESAKFLKMPQSSQNLFFHLVMNADDDGIVEAFTVIRLVNANEDDLKVLGGKGYIAILNEDLVSYICVWRDMNKIRADRKIDSMYQDLLLDKQPDVKLLEKKQRKDVKGSKKSGQSTDDQMTAQYSVVECRSGKDSTVKNSVDKDEYVLGKETLTHVEYTKLVSSFSKQIVDAVIKRIMDHPYIGCLNVPIISQWCQEAQKRNYGTKCSFNQFPQNDYDFDEIERVLLASSGQV